VAGIEDLSDPIDRTDLSNQAALDRALAELTNSPWERTLTVRAGTGYRDNILLSPFAPLGRMFLQTEVEAFVWRLPSGPWEGVGFLSGDVLRYLAAPAETGGEQHWFGHGEIRWSPREVVKLSLAADLYFEDRVMDLSETEAAREVVPARTRGAMLTASGRVDLPAGFAVVPAVQVHRSDFRDFPGDYDEVKSSARLEWKKGDDVTISAGGFERSRGYADRPQFTAGGRALPGTRLHFQQRGGEIKYVETWSAQGRWKLSLGGSALENRDRASGFFNYREKRGTLEVAWEAEPWRISVAGDAKRRDYLVQTAGIGISPPRRIEDDFEASGRIERKFATKWTVYLDEHWERSRSNELDFNYRANTSTIGVQYGY